MEAIALYFSRLWMQVVQHHVLHCTGIGSESCQTHRGSSAPGERGGETLSSPLRGLMIFGDLMALSAAMSSSAGHVVLGGDGLIFRP